VGETRTEVRVHEVVGVVELHHDFWLPCAVSFDILFQTLDYQVVVCVVFLLDVFGMTASGGGRWHFGSGRCFSLAGRYLWTADFEDTAL